VCFNLQSVALAILQQLVYCH